MIWELLFYDSDWLFGYEPQAKAVKLAQLGGEGDSPQCGEMSQRDKRAGHLLKWGTSCPP